MLEKSRSSGDHDVIHSNEAQIGERRQLATSLGSARVIKWSSFNTARNVRDFIPSQPRGTRLGRTGGNAAQPVLTRRHDICGLILE